MGVQLDELVVQLIAEVDKYNANMEAALVATEKATDKMAEAVDEFSSQSEKSLGFFDTAMATTVGFLASELVLGAFNKLQEAAAFAFGEIQEGVEAAGNTEEAFQRLANSLALTGQYTRGTMSELQAYANQLERTTGIDDALTASTLQLLSSLTRLDGQGLQAAHSAAVELSSAIGMDLNGATMLISKGIANSTEVFKRYGIEIQNGSTRAERLANITSALAGMQGTAAGSNETYNGSVRLLNTAYENLLKAIGKYITDNPMVIALIKATTDELNNLTESADGAEAPVSALNLALVTVAEAAGMVVDLFEAFVNVGKMFYASLLGLNIALTAVAETIEGIIADLSNFGQALVGTIFGIDSLKNAIVESNNAFGEIDYSRTGALADELNRVVESEPYFKNVSDSLDRIADAGAGAYNVIKAGAETATPTVQGTTGAVAELTEMQRLHNEAVVAFAENLVQQSVSIRGEYEIQRADLQTALENKTIDYDTWFATRYEQLVTQYAEEQFLLEQARAKNQITEAQYSAASLQLKKNQVNEEKKLNDDRTQNEKKNREMLLQQTGNLFGALAMLQESSNKELVAIGKAAAIAQATINTYVGISKALAEIPYPASVVAATAIGIQGALTVAKISGVGFKHGIDRVPGAGSGDRVNAMLEPGERVTPKRTNRDLTKFLEEQNSGEGGSGAMTINISFDGATIVGDLDSAEFGARVARAIEEAKARGMVAGVA